MIDYAQALESAKAIDPSAIDVDGAPDVLLIDKAHADAVLALFPGAFRDDFETAPEICFTRICLPMD